MFKDWDNFYLMLGGAAGALVGLLFVVVTLNRTSDRARLLRAISIYMTPSALHFALVLAVSAVALAPEVPRQEAAVLVGLAALVGLGNAVWACVGIHGFGKSEDPPHWSDFWLYGVTPTVVYLGLAAAAGGLWEGAHWAVNATAAFVLLLLFVGIRNAWDLVTWLAPRANADPS